MGADDAASAAPTSGPVTGGGWSLATVRQIDRSMAGFVRLRLDVPGWRGHRPGQHVVVRLRATDGYTAQRSYSIASAPSDSLVELMVERLTDGEVSGFLHDEARAGDTFEVRGPIGRWFAWDERERAVALTGGSGVVPAVSMLRHARDINPTSGSGVDSGSGAGGSIAVVAVGRTLAELPYAEELLAHGAFVALTRENLHHRVAAPPYPDEVAPLLDDIDAAFVCGSVGFVGWATRLLREQAVPDAIVRVEQFGVSG